MKFKTCSKCKQEKPVSEFCSNKALPDGLCNQCKTCHNEAKRKWREENIDSVKQANKEYYKEHKSERKAYREAHSEKIKAYLRKYKRIKIYGNLLTEEELTMEQKDRFYYARKYGYRSGLEVKISQQLQNNKIDPHYEEVKLPYTVNKNCTYTPDFIFGHIVIETKGRFLTADRMKMLLVKEQHPEYEFRFIFSNSNAKISKVSKTTYGAWCEKNGFKYADKLIPQDWIEEIRKELEKC